MSRRGTATADGGSNGSAPVRLASALGLRATGELVAIVGGGGKSSLMFALGRGAGRWVLTTTTRIFAAQISSAAAHCTSEARDLAAALDEGIPGLLVVGEVEGDKAFGVPPDLPARILAHPAVDCVAAEADGSRMRPTKAPAAHEPVMPRHTTLAVVVAGIDALEAPIEQASHRPELVSELTGVAAGKPLTATSLAALLRHPRGGLKDVPAPARVVVLLNKVETDHRRRAARRVAQELLTEARIDRVLLGSLRAGDDAGWEVLARAGQDRSGGPRPE